MPEQQTGGGMPQGAGGTPGAGNQESGGRSQEPGGGTPASFEAWLAGQPADVRGLYESHTKGLRSALDSERTERATLAKQLKDASGQATKGSELEKTLADVSIKLEAAERRAQFAEEAHRPEIGCVNAKAAWALAQAEGLFDKRGNPNWAALKAMAPELFGGGASTGSAGVRGNAGAGMGQAPHAAPSMNDFIRRRAGRT